MSGQQFSRFQQQRKGGPTHEELAALYGPLVFDVAVPVMLEVAKSGLVLESDRFDYLKEMLGPDMAAKIGGLKQQIRETVKEEHRGPFDGWVKHVARTEFGAGTDFAMEHGDQELNLICLVLSGQAGRVADIRALEKIVNKEIPSTKKAVGPELKGFMEKIAEVEAGYDKSKTEAVAPWDQEKEPYSAYLKRKTSRETFMKTVQGQIKFLMRVYDRLHEWVNYKKDDDQPKGKKDQLVAQVAGLMDQITGLKAEEADAAGKSEYGIAGQKKNERLALETKVHEIETEIAQLDAVSKSTDSETGTTTPAPGTGAPMGAGPKVKGDPEAAKAAAGDTTTKIEAAKAEVGRLNVEIDQHEKAVETKEREAMEKSKAARTEGASDEEAETLLRDARVLRHSAKASAEATEKLRKRIVEFNAELERLAKAVEPPKTEMKKKATKKKTTAEPSTIVPLVVETDGKKSEAATVKTDDDMPPKPKGNLKKDLAAQIMWHNMKGNTKDVETLMSVLKSIGG